MFSPSAIILSITAYMLVLFLIAILVERKALKGTNIVNNPIIYSLSMAIYCTAWTFYGSVGTAANKGLLFSTVYIGPTLTIMFYWLMVRKMVILKNNYRITSIADFISTRYGKSQTIAAVISLFLFIGIAPYIALQLKAIFSTIDIVTSVTTVSVRPDVKEPDVKVKDKDKGIINNKAIDNTKLPDTEPPKNEDKQPPVSSLPNQIVIALLIVFTILFGVRKLDPTERHQGIVLVVAIESLIKLIAFLSVGFFVTFYLYDGFQDVFSQFNELSLSDETFRLHRSDFNLWMTYFVLSMSAIIFLPRQFHVSVVENFKYRHILTAMWLFPLYLFLINIFVYPLALGGLMRGVPLKMMDFSVLLLPKIENVGWLTMFVFIGGFSAATSMVIVCSMTLSTMVTNHIILPVIIRTQALKSLSSYLLYFRWFVVSLCIVLGYYLSIVWSNAYILVSIGMISFAAVFQLVPALVGGLYWSRGNKMGALLGLCAGFLMWGYTLLLPAMIKSQLVSGYIMDNGLFGLGLLKPEQLFGLHGVAPLTNGVFWSILFNVVAYIGGSMYFGQTEREKTIADSFIDVLRSHASFFTSLSNKYTTGLSEKLRIIESLLTAYIGRQKTDELIHECIETLKLEGKIDISLVELVDMSNMVEKRLSGSIGSASANYIIQHSSLFTTEEKNQLSSIYSNILSELRMSPLELRKRIDYHKEKEAILARHTQELEHKVSERTIELKTANEDIRRAKDEEERANLKLKSAYEKLKDLDKVKTDFLSTVSHELRTPLTSVLGFAKIVKKKLDDVIYPMVNLDTNKKGRKTIEQINNNLEIIVSEGMRLTSLINDVLDIAKMEAGKVDYKRVSISIAEIIDTAMNATTSLFEKKGVQFIKDVEDALPEIMGDRDRIIQVVINLISNAAKFTDEGFITCRALRGDNEIIISVIDTGAGISPSEHQTIFEKFKQGGDTLTSKPKGTGLGLAICREIIEYHGGRVWVESTLGKGSVFTITLPFNASSNERMKTINTDINSFVNKLKEHVSVSVRGVNGDNKTILVVDDDVTIRNLLRQHLVEDGYTVKEAKDGLQAIREVKQERPDLIVLDVMMPEMNGYDVAAVFKNDPLTMSIPIIMFSVIADAERGYRLGVDRYFTKSVDIGVLLNEIYSLTSRQPDKKKVLIVDDRNSDLQQLIEVLQKKGFEILDRCNAEECKRKAKNMLPDMVILVSQNKHAESIINTLRYERRLDEVTFILLEGED
ncbi:sodium:solute symporter [Candidatus Magnetobacterium bavaricum]|uniref:histidine kinase n=1 Tax=Candidatus Magnetobacterium bavaricum TaxID=29290 RepID=A0A0F3GXC6_9BACT|nr:sodium:solute symporter [Candidatus Magnetobacterium bavaricum]